MKAVILTIAITLVSVFNSNGQALKHGTNDTNKEWVFETENGVFDDGSKYSVKFIVGDNEFILKEIKELLKELDLDFDHPDGVEGNMLQWVATDKNDDELYITFEKFNKKSEIEIFNSGVHPEEHIGE